MDRVTIRTKIAVTDVLWSGTGGVVFSGKVPEGGRLIVRLAERLWPVPGEVYEVCGEEAVYIDARGYRHRQVNASVADRTRTSGALVGPWLRTLPGIGAERASRLLERFGCQVLEILGDASRTDDIADALAPGAPQLGRRLAALAQAHFIALREAEGVAVEEAEFYGRLEEHGISSRPAARSLYRLMGTPDAWRRLLQHPYAVAAVLDWREADHVGQRLLTARGDMTEPRRHPARLVAACDAAWRKILTDGDTACPRPAFLVRLKRLGMNASACLDTGTREGRVLVHGDLLRAPGAARLEYLVASDLRRLSRAETAPTDWRTLIGHYGAGSRLTDEQGTAVAQMLERPLSALQGGAGTGKTTAARVLADVWSAAGGRTVLAALSGKAALRLSRSTGRLALTLARLVHGLERRAKLAEQGRPATEELPLLDRRTLLLVDESSMVDLATWRRILERMPDGARLAMIGDVAQLPPVGLGRIYHDVVEDGRVVSTLSQPMRQDRENPIVTAAAMVRDGLLPPVQIYSGPGRGVFIVECPGERLEQELQAVRDELQRGMPPEDGVLVLAARNKTCRRFSFLMQQRRQEEGAAGCRLGPLAPFVAEGDPVIATRNRYDEALMNGLMGRVDDAAVPTFRFDGEDKARTISDEATAELMSAWAITVHRAQGSEAQRVVVALDGSGLLTREWLYTAITRAVEQVVLVGPRAALKDAIARRVTRVTGFAAELAGAFE